MPEPQTETANIATPQPKEDVLKVLDWSPEQAKEILGQTDQVGEFQDEGRRLYVEAKTTGVISIGFSNGNLETPRIEEPYAIFTALKNISQEAGDNKPPENEVKEILKGVADQALSIDSDFNLAVACLDFVADGKIAEKPDLVQKLKDAARTDEEKRNLYFALTNVMKKEGENPNPKPSEVSPEPQSESQTKIETSLGDEETKTQPKTEITELKPTTPVEINPEPQPNQIPIPTENPTLQMTPSAETSSAPTPVETPAATLEPLTGATANPEPATSTVQTPPPPEQAELSSLASAVSQESTPLDTTTPTLGASMGGENPVRPPALGLDNSNLGIPIVEQNQTATNPDAPAVVEATSQGAPSVTGNEIPPNVTPFSGTGTDTLRPAPTNPDLPPIHPQGSAEDQQKKGFHLPWSKQKAA